MNIIGRDILRKLHATNKGFERYVRTRLHSELSKDPLIRSFSHDALNTSERNRVVSEIWAGERRKALAAKACRKRRRRIGTSRSMSCLQQTDFLTDLHKKQDVSYVVQKKNRKKPVEKANSGLSVSLRGREKLTKGLKEKDVVEDRPWKRNFDHCGKCSVCFPCEPMSYVVEENYTALNL